MQVTRDPGSFRDPSGHVHHEGGRIFRTVLPPGADDYEFVRGTGLHEHLQASGSLIGSAPVAELDASWAEGAHVVLEHPRLPFVSYPFEWSFPALKAAALLTLDVSLDALDHGVALSDASAYNIQFDGPRPVFIDYLSFRQYQEGEFWGAHRQFCEQFLNTLLLTAKTGVPYHPWMRGSLEGIPALELAPLLSLRAKASWRMLTQVVLQARFQKGSRAQSAVKVNRMKLPREAYRANMSSLRRWIERLEPASGRYSPWSGYAQDHSYASSEEQRKQQFVAEYAGSVRPDLMWDLGCNTGEYSVVALTAGAGRVVGFEGDHGALDTAYLRATRESLAFLPLYMDLANPSPDQGWAQHERHGLAGRADADGLLALAVIHHLAIGRNIPLAWVVDWLVGLAPTGVIEFVPKADPMVQRLLDLRKDIFADYSWETFIHAVEERAEVVRADTITDAGRKLVWYRRR